jgi:glycosidase
LPLGDDYPHVNVATETAAHDSLLNWNRDLIAIRARNPIVHSGGFMLLDAANPSVLSYVRTAPLGSNGQPAGHAIVVSLNFTGQPQTVHLDLTPARIASTAAKCLLADDTSLNSLTTLTTFTLPPYASLVAEVQ